jgi:hypothetical protein
MGGEIGRKNSFGPKGKVPFVTDRFGKNLHCLKGMNREFQA